MRQGIPLTVVDRDQNCGPRRRDLSRATDEVVTVPTTDGDLLGVLARRPAGPRGRVVGLRESSTGWARGRE